MATIREIRPGTLWVATGGRTGLVDFVWRSGSVSMRFDREEIQYVDPSDIVSPAWLVEGDSLLDNTGEWRMVNSFRWHPTYQQVYVTVQNRQGFLVEEAYAEVLKWQML